MLPAESLGPKVECKREGDLVVSPYTLVLISSISVSAKPAFATHLLNWLTWETGPDQTLLPQPDFFLAPFALRFSGGLKEGRSYPTADCGGIVKSPGRVGCVVPERPAPW